MEIIIKCIGFQKFYGKGNRIKEQAGAELCQAQVKLGVIVDVVEGAWS